MNNDRFKIVFDAGISYSEVYIIDDNWKIYFVRGPRTAKALDIPKQYAVTDSAYCLRMVNPQSVSELYKFAFIPHLASEQDVDWRSLCEDIGFKYISPTCSVEQVLREIRQSKMILT